MRLFSAISILLIFTSCAHVQPKPSTLAAFRFDHDTFAFGNETKWRYENGVHKAELDADNADEKRYTQHCFVMCRAAIQFRKFGRFESSLPKLNAEELADRIREVCRHDVWGDPLPASERVVIPGYSNLRELSRHETASLQEHIGAAWPTYVRPGNFCMVETPSSDHQARTNGEIQEWITSGNPMILWIYNFPKRDINHALVAYAFRKERDRFVYTVYDPNTPDHATTIEYDPKARAFQFPKTFYFAGGKVSVRPVYLSMLQ